VTGDTTAPNFAHAEANALASASGEACATSETCTAADQASDQAAAAVRAPRPVKPDPDRVRLCVATRQELHPNELVRFVLGPDATIVPDLARRLPGRGVWVTASRQAIEQAVKRGLFSKSLKTFAKVDKDLADQVEKLLAIEARQALSLANKAGLVSTGFSKVEIAVEKGQAEALITASDASVDGAGKLSRKFKAIRAAAGQKAPVLQELSTAELNLAIGGSNVVHAALAGGGLGRRVILSFRRLQHFRVSSDAAVSGTMDALASNSDTKSDIKSDIKTDVDAAPVSAVTNLPADSPAGNLDRSPDS
jgi:uncharacterized protein